MATATKSKKVSPKRRRTKPGEVKARKTPEERKAAEDALLDEHGDRYYDMSHPGAVTRATALKKAAKAGHLEKLTGGRISITYSPGMTLDDDSGSVGHGYFGFTACRDFDDFDDGVFLDDRKGDLRSQLVAELDRVGTEYKRLAANIQRKLKGGAH